MFKLRKRQILAFIITVFAIIFTNKIWLSFKPFPVDIDISSKGEANVSVYLNKKNNDNFDSAKFEEQKVNFNEASKIHFDVIRSRFPKRFKLMFTEVYQKNPIIIHNISLNGTNLSFLDYKNHYDILGADVIYENNNLTLKPIHNTIEIIGKDTLNLSTIIHFDLSLLIIITILTYLAAYKLSDYIADFKTIYGKSRIEIVFLTLFFIMLFIPVSHINMNDISKDENRTLAKWKSIFSDNGDINFNFGKDFDAWFNDRFNLRSRLINIYDMRMVLSKDWISPKVIKGKQGWLFYNEEGLEVYVNKVMFTNDELKLIAKYLEDINSYCNRNGKQFYFFIAPDKSKVYGEFYNNKISQYQKYSRANQLVDYLRENTDIKVLYPVNDIIKSKDKGFLYFKQDTHWTYLGAYYAYLKLINVINNDFHNKLFVYKPMKNTKMDSPPSDLKNLSPSILKFEDDGEYFIPEITNSTVKCTSEGTIVKATLSCVNSSPKNIKLLAFTDSFGRYFVKYLPESVKESKWVWQYNIEPVIMEDADIILLEMLERFLPKLVTPEVNKYAL